jgi:hypothetical protein
MPYRIMNNKKNGSVAIHMNANSGNIVIAGNNSVSNIALPGENIVTAVINQLWAGSPSGANSYWEIKRGANVVLVVDSSCWLDFSGNGRQLTLDGSADLTANLIGSTAGTLILDLQKLGTGGAPPLGANSDYVVPGQ